MKLTMEASTQIEFRLTNQDFIDDTITVDVISSDPKVIDRLQRRADLANSIIDAAIAISQYGQRPNKSKQLIKRLRS